LTPTERDCQRAYVPVEFDFFIAERGATPKARCEWLEEVRAGCDQRQTQFVLDARQAPHCERDHRDRVGREVRTRATQKGLAWSKDALVNSKESGIIIHTSQQSIHTKISRLI
jgi:hypothetical protein